MKLSQVRLLLALAGSLAIIGCTQTTHNKSALGHLPGQEPLATDQPRVNSATYCAHGHLLERQGQYERAIVQYRRALSLTPDFMTARNRLGITLNKIGRHADASAEFKQALAQHSQHAYLHNNLGFSLYLEERYPEAIEAINTALELKPNFPRAHMNHALVLARLEKFDQAFEELSQAGSPVDAYFNMGVILTEAERFAQASEYLEAALAANPNFDAARQQLLLVSRLAAEHEAQLALNEALASETLTEQTPPASDVETMDIETAAINTTPKATPQPEEKAGTATIATSSSSTQQLEIVDVENTAAEPTPVVSAAEHEADPVNTFDDSTPADEPTPEPAAVVAAPQQQQAWVIEDVPLSNPSDNVNSQPEQTYSETVASDTPAATSEQSFEEYPAAATANIPEQNEPTAATTAAPSPIATTSGTVIIEDVAINSPATNPPAKQDEPTWSAPQVAVQTAPEPPVEPEAHAAPVETTKPQSVMVVETISLTPGAASAQTTATPEQSPLEPTEGVFVSNEFGSSQGWPGIDEEKLLLMISEALHALQYNPAEFDTLWCEVSYYLNPETAPAIRQPIGK